MSPVGAALGRGAGAASAGFDGAGAAAAPSASSVRMTVPSPTRSPSFTATETTLPAADDGTSIVALSDSSSTQRVFLGHGVAGLHEHRDDRHVLEIPDVGDLDLDLRHSVFPRSEQQVARVAQQGRERGDETRPERPVDRPVVE